MNRPTGNGWFLTDPDTNQWAKKVGPMRWSIFENGDVRTFDVGAMSDEKIRNEIEGYYPSLERLKENSGWPLIVAECMSENRSPARSTA